MRSLKGTIFVFVVILLLAVQGAFLLIMYRSLQQQESSRVAFQLESATRLFESHFETRRDYLAAFAQTVARDFGLRQVFEEDTRSFLVALNNHRERIDADLAMGVTAEGEINGQLITAPAGGGSGGEDVVAGPRQGESFAFPEWLEAQNDTHLYPLDGRFYQLSLVPLTTGATVIGWVGFGFRIDAELADYFASLTRLDTQFWLQGDSSWQLVAASAQDGERAAPAAGDSDPALVEQVSRGETPAGILATLEPVGEVTGQRLVSLMYGDRTDLLAEIRGNWQGLLILAALTLLLSLAGTFFIASRISRPVQVLVQQARQVAGGNYEQPLALRTGGELGALADEFRHMQQAVLSREQRIAQYAYFEELTGLPNRHRLMQVLGARTGDGEPAFRLYKLSIRRIEEINSTLGHAIGDEVIRTVGQRLRQLTGEDRRFHLGANEFVLLQDLSAVDEADGQHQAPHAQMDPRFHYQSISLYIELQAGVALFPEHDRSPSGLLQKASTALQHAKKHGEREQLYHPLMSRENAEHLQLLNDLKYAIEQRQLLLHYQPKLTLADGRIGEVEALVRWQHPERGLVPPDRFIPLAEQTGLINALTRWVLDEAGRQARQWREQGLELTVAVNISAHNLRDRDFPEWVRNALTAHDLPGSALCLEMTEGAVIEDPASAATVLSDLAADGIQLSIDDYGTGYSSLAQLKQLPVTELKIDKSLVLRLLHDPGNQIIVRSTIELAHNMGLRVVAEGVEDAASLQWLKDHDCELAQGFHIRRPATGEEFGAWLRQEGHAGGPSTGGSDSV